jgi:hypothetical protein
LGVNLGGELLGRRGWHDFHLPFDPILPLYHDKSI